MLQKPSIPGYVGLLSSSLAKNPQAGAAEKIKDFLFVSFHSILSRTALSPLSFRLIKVTVTSLRNGSVTSSSHRKHVASQVAGRRWALQGGSTRKATLLPTTVPQNSLKGQNSPGRAWRLHLAPWDTTAAAEPACLGQRRTSPLLSCRFKQVWGQGPQLPCVH